MTRKKRTAWFVISLLLCLSSISYAESIPGEIYVKFKAEKIKLPSGIFAADTAKVRVFAPSIKSLAEKHEVMRFEQVYKEALKVRPDWKQLEDIYVLKFPITKNLKKVLQDFKDDPNVMGATTNSKVWAFSITPNDPSYSLQWGLPKISAPQGWDRTTGSTSVEIAVLDTGLNYNHEDFSGRVDLANAKDLVNNDNDPLDGYGHGTAVSGVIGATTNNGKGIAGVDWKAKILPIKVLNDSGGGSTATVSAGIAYCAALRSVGVNIAALNMSLGQYNDGADRYIEENPSDLQTRCQEAYDQGIVLVAAAGNGGVDWNTYPAYYSTVIAVAATDTNDIRSVWSATDSQTGMTQASNYGSWVDVSAPGTNIYSANNDGAYKYWNGTSLASPFVAGLVGLIKADKPSLTVAEIMSRIKSYADNVDSLQEAAYRGKIGTGRINVQNTLTALKATIISPANGEYKRGTISIIGSSEGRDFASYSLKAIDPASNETVIATGNSQISNGLLGSWDTTGLNGVYTIKLITLASDASSKETHVSVIVDNTPPTIVLSSPIAGQTVSGTLSINGTIEDSNFDRYELKYEKSTSAIFDTIGTFYAPKSGTLGTWETIGLNGNYTFRAAAYDLAGNSAFADLSISLSNAEETNKSVNALSGLPPTVLLPNPFDRKTTSEAIFYYNLRGNFNTIIYLFDLSGTLIWQKRYQSGDNGGKDGINTPKWDGKSLFGENVSAGIYLYQIIADQRIIARGKVVLLN